MTERIDLDDVETDSDGTTEGNPGDWLWRDDAPADAESLERPGGTEIDDGADDRTAVPHVPRRTDGPIGVPAERGGAGTGSTAERSSGGVRPMGDGERGGGVDEMTLAFTHGAISRLADPAGAVAEARGWADWIGIVAEGGAPVVNKFQRDHGVDTDFFNGLGTGPAERLGGVTETSMFYAERMVVVGTPDEERIATEAGWEFVPISDAAAKAGWDLNDG